MQKLKYIRVKQQNGQYTADIPIATDAQHVDMTNGNNLQDTIGNINVTTDGSITQNLNSLRNDYNQLDQDTFKRQDVTTEIPDAVNSWLNTNISATTPLVDSSLSIQGAAADAKVVGDELADVKADLSDVLNNTGVLLTNSKVTWTIGSINTSGNNATSTVKVRSDYIELINCVLAHFEITEGYRFAAFWYNTSKTFLSANYWYEIDMDIEPPSGAKYLRICVTTVPEATASLDYADEIKAFNYTQLKVDINEIGELRDDVSVTNDVIELTEMAELPFKVVGYGYISSTGTIGTSSNYKYTDYIPLRDFGALKYKRGGSTGSSSQYAAVYDKNKQFISATKWATNQSSAGYIDTLGTINNNDERYYVRFTVYADTDTYGEFKLYGTNHPLLLRFADDETEIAKKIETKIEIGKNLFDPSKGTSGYLKSNGGISSDSDYITSDFIPVSNGQSVKINRIRKFLAYDSNKAVISGTFVDVLTNNYVYTATQDGYIRASMYVSYADANMIVYSTVLGAYEPYQETICLDSEIHLSGTMKSDAAKMSGNVLDGKKWVACGDSFTHGDFSDSPTQDYKFTDIPYYGQNKVYPFWIGRRNQGLTVINEAINGSTMGAGENGVNPFSGDRYTAIPSDADYITLMFGINDAGNSVPIGTIDDNDNTTFYGAWNVVLSYLINNFPYAHIGIIVGPGMQTSTGKQYANAEIAVAKKWGIPYLNIQYESGGEKIPLMLRTSNPDVSSSVKSLRDSQQFVSDVSGASNHHPNAKAHELESTFIEAWLKSI